mmetsp:Transcript_58955/g.127991  ORF Transcript_58955/g.127991 Transcript_58955/m.127991 type:complete len:132 (-) Transcript_58955:441-836(-)
MDTNLIDSININGSKWFKCAFDSAFLFCRDVNLIRNNIGLDKGDLHSKYVDFVQSEETFDFMTMQLQQGRRFRSLRIYMVLSYLGMDSVRASLENHCHVNKLFVQGLRNSFGPANIDLVSDNFGLTVFRFL